MSIHWAQNNHTLISWDCPFKDWYYILKHILYIKNSNIGRHFNFTISPVSRVMFIVQYWINKSSWLLHSPLCDPTVGAKVYPASKVYPPSEFFNFLSTPNKSCNFFHNKIQIGIVFDNEQKFHSSSMIFLTFKNPLDKKFFFSR